VRKIRGLYGLPGVGLSFWRELKYNTRRFSSQPPVLNTPCNDPVPASWDTPDSRTLTIELPRCKSHPVVYRSPSLRCKSHPVVYRSPSLVTQHPATVQVSGPSDMSWRAGPQKLKYALGCWKRKKNTSSRGKKLPVGRERKLQSLPLQQLQFEKSIVSSCSLVKVSLSTCISRRPAKLENVLVVYSSQKLELKIHAVHARELQGRLSGCCP